MMENFIVSDRLITINGNTKMCGDKFHIDSKNKKIVWFSGTCTYEKTYIDYLITGKLNKDLDASEIFVDNSALLFDIKTKETFYHSAHQFKNKLEHPWAIGSGSDFALGALKCGRTAIKAVLVASELDTFVGGELDIYEISTDEWRLKES